KPLLTVFYVEKARRGRAAGRGCKSGRGSLVVGTQAPDALPRCKVLVQLDAGGRYGHRLGRREAAEGHRPHGTTRRHRRRPPRSRAPGPPRDCTVGGTPAASPAGAAGGV